MAVTVKQESSKEYVRALRPFYWGGRLINTGDVFEVHHADARSLMAHYKVEPSLAPEEKPAPEEAKPKRGKAEAEPKVEG